MEICIHTEPTQRGADYNTLRALAQATEEAGFDGFFRSDHYLQFGTPVRPAAASDAWISLAGLARDTERVRLGTLVTPVTFRSPVQLAVHVAQVDQMSGGRIELGIGGGWYQAEFEAAAVPFPATDRMARLEEAADIIAGIWGTEPGETFGYEGRRYQVKGAQAAAETVQRPGPPLIVGGSGGARSLALAVRHAAEYNAPFIAPQEAADLRARLAEDAEAAGRETAPRVSVLNTVCCGKDDAHISARADVLGEPLKAESFRGTPGRLVDLFGQYAEAGVSRLYLRMLDMEDLSHLELLADDVLPQLR
ncbi:LLM class flavin-dependent oxidoreductase [Streptomyces sp. NPDC007905]|uniref:LLM class flavin-dependent oxidoreductase n=1 Tax=Streptomyces sp. NPDC007905 TaxID=3364788 RepID=UPI0036EA0831